MEYKESFKKVIRFNTYIGTGCPNSNLLIVGKEVSTDTERANNKSLEIENLKLKRF